MWTWILLIGLLLWIVVSLFRDQRQKMLATMKGDYSKEETVELAIRMKREAGLLFLAYGVALGAIIAGIFMKH